MKAWFLPLFALLALVVTAAQSAAPLDDSVLSGATGGPTNGNPPEVVLPAPGTCINAPKEAGTVRVRIHVNTDGQGDQVLIAASSGNKTLDAAAVAFVKADWRYTVGMLRGRPAGAWLTTGLAFKGDPPACPTIVADAPAKADDRPAPTAQ